MQALLSHLKTWNPNGNGELKHEQLTSVLKELAPNVWSDEKIALLLNNAPDPLLIESLPTLLNNSAVEAFLRKIKEWNPNGDLTLTHDQVNILLQKMDPSYWTEEKIKMLMANFPDPVPITVFGASLLPGGTQPEVTYRGMSDDDLMKVAAARGMKIEYAKKTTPEEQGSRSIEMTAPDAKSIKKELCKPLTPDEVRAIREVFIKYDKDGSGKIDLAELKAMCSELGGKMTDTQATLAMKQLDKCGDGLCDFEEFCLFWTSQPSLGGYDEVSLQVLKGALATRAAAKKAKSKIAAKAGLLKIPEGKAAFRSSFVVSPNMGPFEPKMTAKLALAKTGDPDSKMPNCTIRLAANDEKSASSTKEALEQLFAFMLAMAGEEAPMELITEDVGSAVNIKIKPAEMIVSEMFADEEFQQAIGMAELVYDYVNLSLNWSNDISDVVGQPDKVPFEYLGGLSVEADSMVEFGFLSMMGGDEEQEMAKMMIEAWGGAGTEVKLGYFEKHLKTVARELKALEMEIPTLQMLQKMLLEDRESGSMDIAEKEGFAKMSRVLKELSTGIASVDSITVEGVGAHQATVTFEKFRPWLLLQYILQPILEKDVDNKEDVPKPVGQTSLTKDIGDKERDRIREIFNKYDKDGSGTIDLKEFEGMVKELGGKITTEEAQSAIAQLDKDGSFTVDWQEFLSWWSSQPGCGGYSSVALAFLKMKMAGWNTLMKGKKALVKNTLGVSEDSETLMESSFDLAANMNPTDGVMSANISFDQEVTASSSEPALEARLIANSGDDATKVVALMQEQYSQFAEMVPLSVDFTAEDAEVVIKVSAPAEVVEAMMASAEPDMLESLVTAVQSLLNSSATIGFGCSFEDLIAKADEPLPEMLSGLKFEMKTGVSAAGRAMLAAMTIPGMQNVFRPLVRSFAGFSVSNICGYKPQAITQLLTKLFEMIGMPPMLSLSGLQEMVTMMFPEELSMFLPPMTGVCGGLKGVKSIKLTGFVPKPGDAEGSKLNINISLQNFSVFSLLSFFLKPLETPAA